MSSENVSITLSLHCPGFPVFFIPVPTHISYGAHDTWERFKRTIRTIHHPECKLT